MVRELQDRRRADQDLVAVGELLLVDLAGRCSRCRWSSPRSWSRSGSPPPRLRVLARDAVVEQPDVRPLAAADDRLLGLDLVHLADAGAGQHDQVGPVALHITGGRRCLGHPGAFVDRPSLTFIVSRPPRAAREIGEPFCRAGAERRDRRAGLLRPGVVQARRVRSRHAPHDQHRQDRRRAEMPRRRRRRTGPGAPGLRASPPPRPRRPRARPGTAPRSSRRAASRGRPPFRAGPPPGRGPGREPSPARRRPPPGPARRAGTPPGRRTARPASAIQSKASVSRASPARMAMASPNTLWLLGRPRRKSSSSIAGRSSWISE